MKFNVNIPIYIQLMEDLKIKIITNKILLGQKLPSIRELSNIYKVNQNTLQKALIELERQKLIYTKRTNGKFVTDDKKTIDKIKNEYAKLIANKYFESMDKIGINKARAINYLYERKLEDSL